jgi:sulfite reductase beta subunit-like hemoprotein
LIEEQLMINRLDGIYKQRQDGYYMQRVKLAAGVISAEQAKKVAEISARLGQGTIHLTSRGSMEIHWLQEADLPQVKHEMTKVGLTSRGACGGAVRGITCSSHTAVGFPRLESLARRLHRHFTANPRFEGLPKKFKVGIEADTASGRHLIQDVGLVLAKEEDGRAWYDIWIAGGLGREPQPGFLLAQEVAEERLIPLIEAIVRVYATHAPPPKRLKYLANEFGREKLQQLITAEPGYTEELPPTAGFPEHLMPQGAQQLTIPVFAGQLSSSQLLELADFAANHAAGVLLVTADQDVTFVLSAPLEQQAAATALATIPDLESAAPTCRVCPGNHECAMGLAATRDVARLIVRAIPPTSAELSLAIAGCPNSCTQPQLADVGIVTARLTSDDNGDKTPRFDLYRRSGDGFGTKVAELLTQDELIAAISQIR